MKRTEPNVGTGVARRRTGPTPMVLADLLRHARLSRSWLPLVLIALIVAAAFVIFLGQTVVPWAIYPAL